VDGGPTIQTPAATIAAPLAFRSTRAQIEETARRVNARFGTSGHQPIRLLDVHHEPADVYGLYRSADFSYVGSLHDGMNLVAKEFVSAFSSYPVMIRLCSRSCW
jgi:trehalose 6-phosphate synthase